MTEKLNVSTDAAGADLVGGFCGTKIELFTGDPL